MQLAEQTLAEQGWEAHIQNSGGHDPAINWRIRPAAQAHTPVTFQKVAPLPVTFVRRDEELLLEARQWLDRLKGHLLGGTCGPQQDGGVAVLEGFSPPSGYGTRTSMQVYQVLVAANWEAQLQGDRNDRPIPRIWRKNRHFASVQVGLRPFGYDFPDPDTVNKAIFRARGEAALGAALTSQGGGGTFPSPDEAGLAELATNAQAIGEVDHYAKQVATALQENRVPKTSDGWYSPAGSPSFLHPPKGCLKDGSIQHRRLLAQMGTRWEVRIRSQHEGADGLVYYLEFRAC